MKTIIDVFDESQRSFGNHKRCQKAFVKLYQTEGDKLIDQLFQCVKRVLVVYKREPAVERVVDFVSTSLSTLEDGGQLAIRFMNVGFSLPAFSKRFTYFLFFIFRCWPSTPMQKTKRCDFVYHSC